VDNRSDFPGGTASRSFRRISFDMHRASTFFCGFIMPFRLQL
jgi:hypothetical protein